MLMLLGKSYLIYKEILDLYADTLWAHELSVSLSHWNFPDVISWGRKISCVFNRSVLKLTTGDLFEKKTIIAYNINIQLHEFHVLTSYTNIHQISLLSDIFLPTSSSTCARHWVKNQRLHKFQSGAR